MSENIIEDRKEREKPRQQRNFYDNIHTTAYIQSHMLVAIKKQRKRNIQITKSHACSKMLAVYTFLKTNKHAMILN